MLKKVLIWIGVIFVVLILIGIFTNDTKDTVLKVEATSEPTTNTTPVEQVEKVEQKPRFTNSQQNAIRSAEQYLSFSSFSRNGLIDQLSSSAGDGYDKADATIAVDSLNVDWNDQATQSAQRYLDMMGFSCNGLIDQLSSSAGDKYTKSQAKFGAKQAGACS